MKLEPEVFLADTGQLGHDQYVPWFLEESIIGSITSCTFTRPVCSSFRTLPNGSTLTPPAIRGDVRLDRESVDTVHAAGVAELLRLPQGFALLGKLAELFDQRAQAAQEAAQADVVAFGFSCRFRHRIVTPARRKEQGGEGGRDGPHSRPRAGDCRVGCRSRLERVETLHVDVVAEVGCNIVKAAEEDRPSSG